MEMGSVEISALETLGSGLLYLLFAAIINIAAALVRLHYIVAANAVFLYIMAVGIALFAIFAMIRPGMRQLSEVDNGFRICYTGTTLMLVGLAVLTLGIVVNMAVGIAVLVILNLGGVFIGYAIIFIGHVLTFVVGAFKLHGRYRNHLYVAAGTFFVLSIFLTPIGLLRLDVVLTLAGLSITAVGYVLMHIALGGTIKKLNTQS